MTGASDEFVLLHFSVCCGFADAEQLRGGKDTSPGHLESLFQCRPFQVAKVERFWQRK